MVQQSIGLGAQLARRKPIIFQRTHHSGEELPRTLGTFQLMMLGVGLYAPCLILVSLLGMNPLVAFPIMMGSCAFLMPVGGSRFVASRRYNVRAALGLAAGGVPAVLIAAYIVKSLPLDWLRWLVILVVAYAAVSMLWSAYRDAKPIAP